MAVLVCPDGTSDDGTGTGNCVSSSTEGSELAVAPAIGGDPSSFYYLGYDSGFVIGNSSIFSISSSSSQVFVPDVQGTFGKGPLPSSTIGSITEAFTAVAVYSSTQASGAGVQTYDSVTTTFSDLTGFIVAVGYTLTTTGDVVPLIVRYTPRGTLDTTFNGTGYIVASSGLFTGGAFSILTSVAIDSQGRIVVGGYGNSQPRIFDYLNQLQSLNGSAMFSPASGDEFVGFVARYTAWGAIDSAFDAALLAGAPLGSARNGFASSPPAYKTTGGSTPPTNGGYAGVTADGSRVDTINAVAVDSKDGIFVAGGTGQALAFSLPFVAHYSASGVFDNDLVGGTVRGNWASGTLPLTSPSSSSSVALGSTLPYCGLICVFFEAFTSLAVDSQGRVIAAGWEFGGYPIVARYKISNAGKTSASVRLDTTFNSSGHVSLATNGSTDYVTSVAIDALNGAYIVVGNSAGQTFVNSVNAASAAATQILNGNYAGGATDTFNDVAVITSAGTTRYLAVGSSKDTRPTVVDHSLIASFTPGTLTADASFSSSPFSNADSSVKFTNPLPPLTSALPGSFHSATSRQLGPRKPGSAFDGVTYGGGLVERFNAIAPSADGTAAVVVGYTTDSSASPLTGRSFPILLIYNADGTFPNMAGYDDFFELQSAL